jgi:hypothetical protein
MLIEFLSIKDKMDTAPASRVIDIAIGHGLGETR